MPEAERRYRHVLAVDPRHADALHLLGVVAHQGGRNDLAVDLIGKAIGITGTVAGYHSNLGNVLKELGRLDDAVAAYTTAICCKPDFADAYFNLGIALTILGRPEDAVAAYRTAIRCKPDYAQAHANMGTALTALGRPDDAIAACDTAIRCKPDLAEAHSNRGNALADRGHLDDAVAAYTAAIRCKPDFAQARSNLGNTLRKLGRLDDAVAAYHTALRCKPDFAEAHFNLGNALTDQDRLDDAVAAYSLATRCKPDYAEAYANQGNALAALARLDDAIAVYHTAIRCKPDHAEAYSNLGNVLKDMGCLDDALTAFNTAIRCKPDLAEAYSNLLMSLHYQAGIGGAAILAQARRFAARFERFSGDRQFANDADAGRRLRVGYVSADFRKHSVAFFFEPVLRAQDRAAFEIFCYADVKKPDAVTARLRDLADHWRSTVGLSDAALAERIRQDGIDILVDLAGHSGNNRLPMFAGKPAPVQVTWLGYPGTTGLTAIDYRLVDSITDPETDGNAHASESLFRLADGFLCYAPPENAPEPVTAGSNDGSVTFGSFNNPAKLSTATLDAWAALLARLPDATLSLKGRSFDNAATRALFLARFAERGIAPERIELAGFVTRSADHLALYRKIDVGLDPFPYNGTTTTCEALWMGVPVVSLRGDRHSGRVGAALLTRVGLEELIARDVETYIEIAAALAADHARRAELRRSLRSRMAASPLCDGPGFARALDSAYRAMWRKWCALNPSPRD